MMLTDHALERYARQIILPGFGEESQETLSRRHVAVIGAGGLGAPVIAYLAAAGVGRLTIIDDDVVERSNLNRQIIHTTESIGMGKARHAASMAQRINDDIEVVFHSARLTAAPDTPPDTAAPDAGPDAPDAPIGDTLIGDADIIADCSDTWATRYDANRLAHRLGRVLVFGGAVRLEGQVSSFVSGRDKTSPCFACVFPAGAGQPLAPRCSEAGILGPVVGVIGTLMAHEILRQCLLPETPIGAPLIGRLLLIDAAAASLMTIKTAKRGDCPVCGG